MNKKQLIAEIKKVSSAPVEESVLEKMSHKELEEVLKQAQSAPKDNDLLGGDSVSPSQGSDGHDGAPVSPAQDQPISTVGTVDASQTVIPPVPSSPSQASSVASSDGEAVVRQDDILLGEHPVTGEPVRVSTQGIGKKK